MELIIIDPTRLKIMLTEPDMRRYDLSCGSLDCTDEGTRRTFRRIIDDARLRTGFDTAGQQLFVQLYTSKDGGCEIFVTKLGEADGGDAPLMRLSGPEQALLKRVFATEPGGTPSRAELSPVPASLPATKPAAVLFDGVEPLLSACRRLSRAGYADDSRAFVLEDGRYCLLLRVPDAPFASFGRLPRGYMFLSEYGEPADGRLMEACMCEHGTVVCEAEAVEVLGRL